jgi:hypothetical protein
MLLKILAEAVNAVADWPQYVARADDEPFLREIGYRVGGLRWRCSITQVRREIPDLQTKCAQLRVMAKGIKFPLLAYPAQQREREILARAALLKSAVHVSNAEMRRETAHWITFLGRLRAAPDGSLLCGWDGDDEVLPDPWS